MNSRMPFLRLFKGPTLKVSVVNFGIRCPFYISINNIMNFPTYYNNIHVFFSYFGFRSC